MDGMDEMRVSATVTPGPEPMQPETREALQNMAGKAFEALRGGASGPRNDQEFEIARLRNELHLATATAEREKRMRDESETARVNLAEEIMAIKGELVQERARRGQAELDRDVVEAINRRLTAWFEEVGAASVRMVDELQVLQAGRMEAIGVGSNEG